MPGAASFSRTSRQSRNSARKLGPKYIPGRKTWQPAFRAVDGDATLWGTHAVLVFLALKYSEDNWMPADPIGAGEVMQWLSVAANDMQHSLNEAWLVAAFNIGTDLEGAQARAKAVLDIMEQHLQTRHWLALGQVGRLTVADVACYPYIAVAPDGKIDLTPYTAIQTWLKRVEALPGFVPMLPN